MSLQQISAKESNVLLKQKNVLSAVVLEKYRSAGQIAQTCLQYLVSLINSSYHLGEHSPYTSAELCILGDSYIEEALSKCFNDVKEKGIAQPVTIDVNDLVEGYSPELDDQSNLTFHPGDIVTINLGVQVDGYTARVAHTVVIFPAGAQPSGPLLGGPADALCAAHIATEAVASLLGCALAPEKLPRSVAPAGGRVDGTLIRGVVDAIAESYHCAVVPGSKVRRIRRFLAGQAEGIVAERDFKGVVWSEADQEKKLLQKSAELSSKGQLVLKESADRRPKQADPDHSIPTDEFVVKAGEVYTIDLRLAPLRGTGPGIVTLETLDQYSGKNQSYDDLNPRPSVFVRDVGVTYQLKLKTARGLLSKIDKTHPVYPFKLSDLSEHFPLSNESENDNDSAVQAKEIDADVKRFRLGMAEITNQRLAIAKPVLAARFVDLATVLSSHNSTGVHGYDAENPALPGMELPLPELGITALGLKALTKNSSKLPVAREFSTVVLDNSGSDSAEPQLLRITGGSTCKPSWCHSDYTLPENVAQGIKDLQLLTQDARFGIRVRQCRPMKRQLGQLVARADAEMDTA